MKITYNSPTILTFTLLSVSVLILSSVLGDQFRALFTVYAFHPLNPFNYFQLVSHILGHADWPHLLGNFSFILLLGPLLEEKYGSKTLLWMILITAFITGVLYLILFSGGLLGASGIVFMLIILSSLGRFREGTIPLTFILIAILFVGKEVVNAFQTNQISEFAHILGGICGAIFGFTLKGDKLG